MDEDRFPVTARRTVHELDSGSGREDFVSGEQQYENAVYDYYPFPDGPPIPEVARVEKPKYVLGWKPKKPENPKPVPMGQVFCFGCGTPRGLNRTVLDAKVIQTDGYAR